MRKRYIVLIGTLTFVVGNFTGYNGYHQGEQLVLDSDLASCASEALEPVAVVTIASSVGTQKGCASAQQLEFIGEALQVYEALQLLEAPEVAPEPASPIPMQPSNRT